ncbi:nuclear transport factor 2 family protein [Pyxidicoccus fallax]|uniref:Nuclear transport factor 2 family protein n=1 Tax=Pyxidicoccus fallax TaxID=394095 RepID=A0A848LGM5_9BACT|nr:nuclear transport factor 2 family protein [Pyxidicoccus fallax]NMO15188.1 nuclear transport factor 2 family protein [Pyxidicoccus fallax]NPC76887.1 nuclear transport factor 2 family protein [Pyxidicoccus fallax]
MSPSDTATKDPASLGQRWSRALETLFREREPALPAFLSLYDEHIQFQDPLHRVSGVAAYAELNRRFLARARRLEISVEDVAEQDGLVFASWRMCFAPRIGPELTLEGVSHLRTREGRIVHQRDHFDIAGGVASAVPGLSSLYRAVLSRAT